MDRKNCGFVYKLSQSQWFRRSMVMLVLAVMLVLPAGEALAAGLLRLGSRGPEVTGSTGIEKSWLFYSLENHRLLWHHYQNAVIRFQRDNRLLVDGIVGQQTRTIVWKSKQWCCCSESKHCYTKGQGQHLLACPNYSC